MIEAFTRLNEIGGDVVIVVILLILMLVPQAIESWNKFLNSIGLVKRKSIDQKKHETDLKELKKEINNIQNEFYEKQQKYHQQSIEIRNKLMQEQNNIQKAQQDIQKQFMEALIRVEEKQDELAKKQDHNYQKLHDLDERSKNYELSSTKDKLLQLYRYYTNKDLNPLGQWTSLEADSFWGIFHSYEAANGNGEMHTKVQPEMNELLVINIDDVNGVNALMESRKR